MAFVPSRDSRNEGAVDLDGLPLGGYCTRASCEKSWWNKIHPYIGTRLADLPEGERPYVSPTREDIEQGLVELREPPEETRREEQEPIRPSSSRHRAQSLSQEIDVTGEEGDEPTVAPRGSVSSFLPGSEGRGRSGPGPAASAAAEFIPLQVRSRSRTRRHRSRSRPRSSGRDRRRPPELGRPLPPRPSRRDFDRHKEELAARREHQADRDRRLAAGLTYPRFERELVITHHLGPMALPEGRVRDWCGVSLFVPVTPEARRRHADHPFQAPSGLDRLWDTLLPTAD